MQVIDIGTGPDTGDGDSLRVISQKVNANFEELYARGVFVKEAAPTANGIADDTEILRALHTYANTHNIPVSYRGIETIAVQYDAEIPINTDVDFANAKIVLLNGMRETAVYPTTGAFIIADPSASGSWANPEIDGNLITEGDLYPTAQWSDLPGLYVVYCENGPIQPDRFSGSRIYRQTYYLLPNGRAMQGASISYNGCTDLAVFHREDSGRGRILIQNVKFDVFQANSACLLWVARNKVDIDRVTLLSEGSPVDDGRNQYIRANRCGDVRLSHISGHGAPGSPSDSGYIFYVWESAEVYVNDVCVDGGWLSWIATHDCNGFYARNCNVNRLDIHAGGHNFFLEDCSYNNFNYGWCGGIISIKGCTSRESSAIFRRVDYSGACLGGAELKIIDHTIIDNNNNVSIIDMHSNPVGADYASVPMFRTISIDGVTIKSNTVDPNVVRVLLIGLLGSTDPSIMPALFPQTIRISNVVCNKGWYAAMWLDVANTNSAGHFSGCKIQVRNITATNAKPGGASAQQSVYAPAKSRSDVTSFPVFLEVSHFHNLLVNMKEMDVSRLDLRVHNGLCNGLYLPAGTRGEVVTRFVDPVVISPATTTPVASAMVGVRHVSLNTCAFGAGQWDASLIGASIGTRIEAPSDFTYPAGVTRSDMFDGWAAASLIS